MRVNLHIDRLVLEGLSLSQAREVGAALERELVRLISEQGLPPAWGSSGAPGPVAISRLDAVPLDASPNLRPEALGAGIARRVHASVPRREPSGAGEPSGGRRP